MTFLDPISGLIAAAIAVPLLLLLYFLKLRRRPLRVSSTLLWEQAVRDLQVNVPLRWLRLSAVLFLQMLALVALVAALARPAIPSETPAADRTVIIIDHSASMSARDGAAASPESGVMPANGDVAPTLTRLDEAKRRAIELVRELARGTTSTGERPAVTVIASAASARVIQPATAITADIIDAIESIAPTDHPGGVAAAVELIEAARAANAATETADAGGAGSETTVAFTDRAEREPVAGRIRIIRVGQRVVGAASPATPTTPATATMTNTGIVALSVRRDAEQPDTVRVFARLVSTSPVAQSVVVRCLVDDRLVGLTRVEIPAFAAGAAPANRSGGEASATFDFSRRDGGVVLVTTDSADLLDCDNAAAAVIGPVASPSILVVSPATGGDAMAADPFLLGFLESLSPRALRLVDQAAFEDEVVSAQAEQRPAFRTFNLVVFDGVTPRAIPSQPSISFGAGLPLPGLTLRPPPEGARGTVRFDTWRRSHPLMRYVALEPIVVSPPPPTIETDAPAPSPAPAPATAANPTSGQITVLASGPHGPLIAALEQPGLGPRRVVVAFPLLRSNWGPDTSFAVFMANAVDLLSGRGDAGAGRWIAAGQPITVRVATGAGAAREIEAVGPETLSAPVPRADDGVSAQTVSLGVPTRAGVYQLTGAEQPAICVNLADEVESVLGAGTPADQRAVATSAPDASATLVATGEGSKQGRREIWHWFVLAAMVIAAVEWVVFALGIRA